MSRSEPRHPLPPSPPVRPDNDECCQSGCEPCIFDLYAAELEKYHVALAAWQRLQTESEPAAAAGKKPRRGTSRK